MKQPYEMNLNYIEKKDEWLKKVASISDIERLKNNNDGCL